MPGQEANRAIEALQSRLSGRDNGWRPKLPERSAKQTSPAPAVLTANLPYSRGSKAEATRKAFGVALAEIGRANPAIVALDGGVKNSTYTEDFEKVCPDRFFQMYIAEQNMVGAAMGLAASGKIPFAATFACFLTRAYDFIRMAAISHSNIKLVGSQPVSR
jgi:transketolase